MRTLILVGASNVTLALPILWSSLLKSPLPTRLVVVAGHGRSFGKPSSVLGRALPGILQSDFWTRFKTLLTPQDDVRAFVTDVGNDVLYGAEVQTIDTWVRECLQRLSVWTSRIALTELPLCSLSRLGRSRFQFFRTLFFPGSTITFETAQASGVTLNARVQEIASAFGATLCVPQREWYGLDPIHIRRRYRAEVWQSLLRTLDDSVECRDVSLRRAVETWRLPPEVRWRRGREARTEQPILSISGHELWLF